MQLSELLKCVKDAEISVWGGGDVEGVRICEDSRKVRAGDLFVARSGTKVTGMAFVKDAIARGAVVVVSEEPTPLLSPGIAIPGLDGIAWVKVPNANLAAALLAHEMAGRPTSGMKVIGVTGTKGKTTVAYLMRSVLKDAGYKVGMIGTVELDDGKKVIPAEMTTPGATELVDLFCRMRTNGVTHCIMEVSSHALHQHRVAGIDFAVGIFTNLTGDHLDYHKTMDAYAAAKAMLFTGLRRKAVAVVNMDDPYWGIVAQSCRAEIVPIRVEPMSGAKAPHHLASPNPPKNGWAALVSWLSSRGMQLQIKNNDAKGVGACEVYTPLIGRHNAYNLLSVIAAATALGIEVYDTLNTLEKSTGAPGRLQRVESDMKFSVFVDYAHTHDALENVLTALRATIGGPPPRLICLFGCGGDRDRTKRPKMAAVAERLADVVIVTSDNPRTENPQTIIEEICTGFSQSPSAPGSAGGLGGKIIVEPDRRLAIQKAIELAQKGGGGDVVLLAGKGHENYQIIGTTKHHFDDLEEATAAMKQRRNADKRLDGLTT
ncbi:MAG: UDP-N-acetylmuramoyl-L-alanyl-D-glutamate--2,6-diaminopimelate ligase [Phycisphaerales bacterium]|nr:UDP-N-acetylmuramoyl-L-alanyl-D-glutamate--2,6-diaminopimelate ligase [Phycisphaerales bacterium]